MKGGQTETRKVLESGPISQMLWQGRVSMFRKFMELCKPDASMEMVDVGCSPSENRYENYIEKLYPYPSKITLCGIENCSHLVEYFGVKDFVQSYDGQPLPFPDNRFDIVFCNAVLEHVGSRDKQAAFVSELIRVGRKCFFTTPNRYFPMELHTMYPFIHWLPQGVFQAILRKRGKTFYAKTENLNLLSKRDLLGMIPAEYRASASIYVNRFLGMPANLLCFIDKS